MYIVRDISNVEIGKHSTGRLLLPHKTKTLVPLTQPVQCNDGPIVMSRYARTQEPIDTCPTHVQKKSKGGEVFT